MSSKVCGWARPLTKIHQNEPFWHRLPEACNERGGMSAFRKWCALDLSPAVAFFTFGGGEGEWTSKGATSCINTVFLTPGIPCMQRPAPLSGRTIQVMVLCASISEIPPAVPQKKHVHRNISCTLPECIGGVSGGLHKVHGRYIYSMPTPHR